MEPYQPIDCDFHDELESLATLKRSCDIVYRDETGQERATRDTIVDIFTEEREEYLRLRGGPVIRLDAVVSVDGKRPGRL